MLGFLVVAAAEGLHAKANLRHVAIDIYTCCMVVYFYGLLGSDPCCLLNNSVIQLVL